MPTLIKQDARFTGFGDSLVPRAARKSTVTLELSKDRLECRKLLHKACPRLPGIYGMINSGGRLIYVGKSKSLRSRLLTYFAKTPADEKMTKIIRQARRIVFEPCTHELLSLLREQELISRFRPQMNTQDQPARRQPAYVCIGGGSAPKTYHSRTLANCSEIGFGPIQGSGKVAEAAVSLNYAFHLRDCSDKTPMSYPEQLELFPSEKSALCLRFELKSCLAPCAGMCKRNQYHRNVERAHNFLLGKETTILGRLAEEMKRAAEIQAFEKAVVLRDRIEQLTWLDAQLEKLRVARHLLHGVFPIAGFKDRPIWLVLRNSVLQGGFAEPRDINSRMKALIRLRVSDTRLPEQVLSIPEILMQLRVISWFRKHPQDELKIIPFSEARAMCGDETATRAKVG